MTRGVASKSIQRVAVIYVFWRTEEEGAVDTGKLAAVSGVAGG
jgi:hypothetical protein